MYVRTYVCMYIARARCQRLNGSGVDWAECSLIIGTGCWVQVFSLILDSSVGLSAGIQSAGDSVPKTLVQILHSAEEDKLSPFDVKIACLCQSIEISDKHVCMYVCMHAHVCMHACMHVYACMDACICMHACVYAHMYACVYVCMHVANSRSSGLNVHFFISLILDSSVGLSAGIQAAEDSVPETLGSNAALSRGRQHVSFRFENRLPVPEHLNQPQQTCISPEPGATTNQQCGRVSRMLAVSLASLILHSSVGLSEGIQAAKDSFPDTLGSNPALNRGRQHASFRFENRLPVPGHKNKKQQIYMYGWCMHVSLAGGLDRYEFM